MTGIQDKIYHKTAYTGDQVEQKPLTMDGSDNETFRIEAEQGWHPNDDWMELDKPPAQEEFRPSPRYANVRAGMSGLTGL